MNRQAVLKNNKNCFRYLATATAVALGPWPPGVSRPQQNAALHTAINRKLSATCGAGVLYVLPCVVAHVPWTFLFSMCASCHTPGGLSTISLHGSLGQSARRPAIGHQLAAGYVLTSRVTLMPCETAVKGRPNVAQGAAMGAWVIWAVWACPF